MKEKGRLRLRDTQDTGQVKLTLQRSYMTCPRAATDRWKGGQVGKACRSSERKQKAGKVTANTGNDKTLRVQIPLLRRTHNDLLHYNQDFHLA